MSDLNIRKKGMIRKHIETGEVNGVQESNFTKICKEIGVSPTQYKRHKRSLEQKSYNKKKK